MLKYVKGYICDKIFDFHVFEGCSPSLNFDYEYKPFHIPMLDHGLQKYIDYCNFLYKIECNLISNARLVPCPSLTQIIIPSSVTSIENYAFGGCSLLTQITIPSSVISIGIYAFSQYPSLKQISIPSTLHIDNVEIDQKVIITRF